MSKTPISILQEEMVISYKSKPRYEEVISDSTQHRFKCVVHVDGITAAGYGDTKQSAKQNSAAKALKKLGLVTECNNNNNDDDGLSYPLKNTASRFINYVGELNELASTHAKPYAIYVDQSLLNLRTFSVQCNFLEWTTKGCGTTRKGAKQDSAKNMLDLLKTKDISIVGAAKENLGTNQIENINKLTEEVIRKIEKLPTISGSNDRSTDGLMLPTFSKRIDSLDDLKTSLANRGYKCSFSIVQQYPVVMMMKVDGTKCVIMGSGSSYELAAQDLLQLASLMLSSGFSMIS